MRGSAMTGVSDGAERGAGRGVGGVARAVGRAWIRGWTAFVAAMGEPYLSMVGRGPARFTDPAADAPGAGGREEHDGDAELSRRSA